VKCPERRATRTPPQPAPDGSEPPAIGNEAPGSHEVFHGYELLGALECGGMAQAFRARQASTGKTVFVKRVPAKSTDKIALEREARIYEKLMRLNPEHVLRVLDFLRDDDYVALVTEFADGGDLQCYVEQHGGNHGLNVGEAKAIGLAVATALKELHSHDIVHRDLKPQNVLCLSGKWKLADFGISKNLSRVMTQRTLQGYGTLGYAAPEQFQGVEARPSADIYSLGKVLVFLLTGQTDADHVTFTAWRELISPCVRADADTRPPIDAILDQLRELPS